MPHLPKNRSLTRRALVLEAVRALNNYKQVFVSGPYGIGKTTFARQVQTELKGPSLVMSMEENPGDVAKNILAALRAHSKTAGAAVRTFIGVKNQIRMFNRSKFVVVVDDFFRSTNPKIGFLGFLLQYGFRLIIVVESKPNAESWASLTRLCEPYHHISLPRLTLDEGVELAKTLAREYDVSAGDGDALALASKCMGYPLMFVEHFRDQKKKRKEHYCEAGQ